MLAIGAVNMKLVLFLLATSVSCAWATDLDNVLRRIEFLEKTGTANFVLTICCFREKILVVFIF